MMNRTIPPATILVVDDSITVRMALSDILKGNGYHVLLAGSGDEAMTIIRSSQIDAVLLDVVMPDVSGTDVLRTIKQDESLASIPVIMLTAISNMDDVVKNLDQGADDYLVKPWHDRELLARLTSMVRMKRAYDAIRDGEARLASILDSVVEAIICADENGTIISWNQGATDIFGYTLEDVLGKSLTLLMPQHLQDSHQHGLERFRLTREACVMGGTLELVGTRKDGTEFPLELSVTTYTVGGELYLTGIIRDITIRKRVEAERAELNEQLVAASRRAGKADLATEVLHSVGNALNSVTVSSTLISEHLRTSSLTHLEQVCVLIDEAGDEFGTFVTKDARGKRLPAFLRQLSRRLAAERDGTLDELASLLQSVEHIKRIISVQQSYAVVSGITRPVNVVRLLDDALNSVNDSLLRGGIAVIRQVEEVPDVLTDKHKLLQIVTNLLANAIHALQDSRSIERQLTVRVYRQSPDHVVIEVVDNGVGIRSEHLSKIFEHGFTTRKDGNGFGLHSSANAAKELGITLAADSAGPGCGALFRLAIPFKEDTSLACTA